MPEAQGGLITHPRCHKPARSMIGDQIANSEEYELELGEGHATHMHMPWSTCRSYYVCLHQVYTCLHARHS
jgi:hypothetical protein